VIKQTSYSYKIQIVVAVVVVLLVLGITHDDHGERREKVDLKEEREEGQDRV
jgi:hypothetical protein